MTSLPTRRIAFGAVLVSAIGTLGTAAAVAPAIANSPSYTVTCASAQVDAGRGETTDFTLSCEDSNGDAVDSYVVLTQPTKAQTFTVNAATGAVSYRSTDAARGTDSFTFKGVVEGLGESPVTTATITLANERPACDPVADLTTEHDTAAVVPLVCEDADGDELTLMTGTTGASHGTVAVVDGEVVYTPSAKYVGADTFTLRAGDGDLVSTEVSVDVVVTNARPTCTGGPVSTVHDRAKVWTLSCADADGDALARSVVAKAQHGTVSIVGSKVTYKPAKGYVGSDTFTVGATDGIQASVPVRYSVKVTNYAPSCVGTRSLTARGTKAVAVRFVCSDRDRDAVRALVATAPRHGKLVRKGSGFVYVAKRGYAGRDSFRLVGFDGVAKGSALTYSVSVKRR